MNRLFAGFVGCAVVALSASLACAIDSKAGTTAGEFLRLSAGARAAAMGEAFAAAADDVSSVYWNPAGLTRVQGKQALLAHTLWYMDVNHEYAAYAQALPNGLGAIGASVTYLMTSFEKRTGDTEAADSSGSIGDMAVGISYARPIAYGIDGGITAKYISSTIDANTASSVAFDIGVKRSYKNLTGGLAVRNLGGALKYVSEAVAIGNTADLGFALKDAYFKNLTVAADYTMLINGGSSSVNAGVEYAMEFKNGLSLAPRAGYKTNGAQISAGVGFGWKGYGLDYAFVPHADLGSAQRISFNLKF